jgi:hypothetical protein
MAEFQNSLNRGIKFLTVMMLITFLTLFWILT